VVEVTAQNLGGFDGNEVGRRGGVDSTPVVRDEFGAFEAYVNLVAVKENSTILHLTSKIVC
jgi:hypothetical protein